jgi:hypothetical protein
MSEASAVKPVDDVSIAGGRSPREIMREAYGARAKVGAMSFDDLMVAVETERAKSGPGDVLGTLTHEDLVRWARAQALMQNANAMQAQAKNSAERAMSELRALYGDIGERLGVPDDKVVPAFLDPVDLEFRAVGAAQPTAPPERPAPLRNVRAVR